MAVFAYQAIDRDRSLLEGTVSADTPRQARDQLRDRGLLVQAVTPVTAGGSKRWWRYLHTSGQRHHVVGLIRELSTLLGVGIPLLQALETIAKQHSGAFAQVVLLLRERVAAGISLAEAMREQPRYFDELCVSLVEVGESAGTLETALEQLAEHRERQLQLKNRLGTALLYPCIVLLTGLGVSLFLMTFVVPNLLSTLVAAGKPLPWSTKLLKGASDLLVQRWWLLLLVAGGLSLLITALLRTRKGRACWHRGQLRIPLLGQLIRKQAIVRMALVISTLLKSGIPFVRAVQIAQRSTANDVLRQALVRCEQAVYAGQDIALALEETRAFPPLVLQVFSVGQQSGRLEEMLDRLALDYDRQVTLLAQRFTAALEPILILFLAVIVGFIAFATVLPILEAGNVL